MSFSAYCHSERTLSASTIKTYLAGVQHFRSLQVPDRPSIFAAHPLKAVLRGIQKTQGSSRLSRQPITGQIFRDLSDILSTSPFGVGPSLVLKAAIHLSFFGFLRPGEVSRASCHAPVLLRGSLARFPEHYELQLPNNKTRQIGQGFVVKYYRTHNSWCPVEVLDSLDRLFTSSPRDSPLLPFPTHPITSKQFIGHVRILLANLHLDPVRFSGHSFRIGAASAASKQGVPSYIIKHMGRWSSSCYSRYIPEPHMEVRRAFAILLD